MPQDSQVDSHAAFGLMRQLLGTVLDATGACASGQVVGQLRRSATRAAVLAAGLRHGDEAANRDHASASLAELRAMESLVQSPETSSAVGRESLHRILAVERRAAAALAPLACSCA